MNNHILSVAFLSLALGASSLAYADKKDDKKAAKRIKADITYLASDELEGRRTSTAGEALAADYIENRYKELGIAPFKGKYRYPFHFVYGKEVASSTRIMAGNTVLRLKEDAFPMPFSASGDLKDEVSIDRNISGHIWLLSLYDKEEDANSPHFEFEKVMAEKAKDAEKQGATAVIFYDAYGSPYAPAFNNHSEYDPVGIPVVMIKHDAYVKYFQGPAAVAVSLNVTINKTERTGTNVAAFIDNQARYTVILGAHYDHLGYGEDGNSLHANASKDHLIHHGADDNASGTAALLEEARWIKENKDQLKNYNYLLINFSGEELGLYGSKAIVKSEKIDSNDFAYMINMDMVGRLNDSTHSLELGGLGTSPSWAGLEKMGTDFKLTIDSSGVGPSDHTSFYTAGLPVLFFFTGTHKDYHKPSDVASLINYPGEVLVLHYIDDILLKLDAENKKPRYTVTKSISTSNVSFKVTLGIMPDYTFQEGGVRVDGVSEGRPAATAGILKGDIIIQLGDLKIAGMQSYMEALGKFKPGDRTNVTINRNGKELVLPIELKGK